MPTLMQIARTINGPNESTQIGMAKLIELQDLQFNRMKAPDQASLLRTARFVQELFDDVDNGWVITSADDTKARCFEYNEVAGNYINWTNDLDKAMWFARRSDAERFGADDEDAWHMRRVSEVRAVWAVAPSIEGVPTLERGAPHAPDVETGAIAPAGPLKPPPPPALPVCHLGDNDLLRIFRQFVLLNVTQWAMGAGDHHHPIWADLAVAIDKEEQSSGPDWQFVQPLNRMPHAVLLAAFIDAVEKQRDMERGR